VDAEDANFKIDKAKVEVDILALGRDELLD
jgi:hypothetical protein